MVLSASIAFKVSVSLSASSRCVPFSKATPSSVIEVRIRKDEVEGVIMYTDDDMQRFVWHYSNLNHLKMATELLDILKQKEWISIDKIIVSEKELIKYLEEIGWNMDDINNVLFFLVSLNINMIDEGEETDMFFVHF